MGDVETKDTVKRLRRTDKASFDHVLNFVYSRPSGTIIDGECDVVRSLVDVFVDILKEVGGTGDFEIQMAEMTTKESQVVRNHPSILLCQSAVDNTACNRVNMGLGAQRHRIIESAFSAFGPTAVLLARGISGSCMSMKHELFH